MLKWFARLCVWVAFLGLSGWFVARVASGWNNVWRKPLASVVERGPISGIDPALAKDPAVEAAKLKVVGPLAMAMKAESQDPQGAPPGGELPNDSPSGQTTVFDRVGTASKAPPRRFHANFLVKNYSFYRLLVPAHTSSPRLQGHFAVFSTDTNKSQASAQFLVLDKEQFNDFRHGNLGSAFFSSESSSGTIDVVLSPAIFESKEYYLVFRSTDTHTRFVKADLTASFE